MGLPAQTGSPEVIFRNDEYVVINKPSGWIVNRATSAKPPIIQDWVEEELDIESGVERSGIVHRLDKETSGALVIAKTASAFEHLQKEFKERRVGKQYLALVHGVFTEKEGEISAQIGRLPWNRERFGVLAGGREADTKYKVEEEYQKGKEAYSLLRLFPKTGRTHQIRVHMKHLGHPVVADTFYAGRKTARADRAWSERMFLHAARISFVDAAGKEIAVETPLPPELKKALSHLEKPVGSDVS